MKHYTLHLTEGQAVALSQACELVSRLHMGQIKDLEWSVEYPGTQNREDVWALCDAMKHLMWPDYPNNANPGITSPEVHDVARVLYDLHQVIRKAIAGEKPEGSFPLVCYDTPMRTSGTECLAKCQVEEG